MRHMLHYTLIAEFVVDDPSEAAEFEENLRGTGAQIIIRDAGGENMTDGNVRDAISRSGAASQDEISPQHRLVTILATGRRADSETFHSAVEAVGQASH